MPSTPTHGLRWPLSTATPDVPRDLQNLAEDTDSALTAVQETWDVYARGTISDTSVAPNTTVTLGLTSTSASGITLAANTLTLPRTGYYAITAGVTNTIAAAGVRSFVDIVQAGVYDYRANFGDSENKTTDTAVIHCNSGQLVRFAGWHNSGGAVFFSGRYTVKYLGGL